MEGAEKIRTRNCKKRETYSQYENGQRQIPIDVLVKLARYYGVSTDYLLGLTDDKKPYPPV